MSVNISLIDYNALLIRWIKVRFLDGRGLNNLFAIIFLTNSTYCDVCLTS